LNAGYKRGGKVRRCADFGRRREEYDVYCPKALTGIGKIPDTVHDRCLDIRLVRESKGTGVKFRSKTAEPEAAPIRAELQAWAAKAKKDMLDATPRLPDQLTGRQQDICEPLLAVAEAAGGEWADNGPIALITICASNEDQSTGIQLLASVREAFS